MDLRDGKGEFDGEVFFIHDGGDEIVCLFVPTSYVYSAEQFEHSAGDTMRAAETSEDWVEVRHPMLVTMRDQDMHDIPQKLKLVGGGDDK
jgi:hypothetical protein